MGLIRHVTGPPRRFIRGLFGDNVVGIGQGVHLLHDGLRCGLDRRIGVVPQQPSLAVDLFGGQLTQVLDDLRLVRESLAVRAVPYGLVQSRQVSTVRNGNCYLCYNCGNSMGCS